jgi:hypothetical protein
MALLVGGNEDAALTQLEQTIADGAYVSRSDHFVEPLLRRGNRMAALMLLDTNELEPGLRAIVLDALEHPERPRADLSTIEARYLTDPEAAANRVVGRSRIYLWLGELDEVGATYDGATTSIVAWERYPAAFRNSPGMKRKLVDMGVVAYWRAHGFPPQCTPRGDHDFHCE